MTSRTHKNNTYTMAKKIKQGKKPGNRKNIEKNRRRIEANHALLKGLKELK